MAITLNNIDFSRTTNLGTGTSIPLVRKSGMSESVMNTMISQITDSSQLASAIGAVNALNIDWNGAQVKLGSDTAARTINTTGDLLKAIIDASIRRDFAKAA